MPSTYSTNLAIELIGTGDQAGTWGSTTNTNLGTLIEQAISGYVTQAVSTGTTTTITIPSGASGTARNMFIELTGTGGTNTFLEVPSNKKLYFIYNNTAGAVTVRVSGQTGVSVPAGAKILLVSNGTDVVNATNYMASLTLGTALPAASGGTGTTTSTGTGSVVLSSSPTLTTPNLGTPSAATLTNATGLPISTGVSGLGSGIATFLATPSSSNLRSAVTDETGTGSLVFSTSPSLTSPLLGTPTSGTLTNCTGLPISTGVSGLGSGVATFLATPNSANLRSAVSDETGSGSLVFATSPTLVTPVLGTPTSGTLTNCTDLPITSGVSGLGTNVATFLTTPTSANLAAAVSDETGSGPLVFSNSPTLVSPALGTPSSGNLANCIFPTLNQNTTGSAGSLATTNWTVVESGGYIYFKYGGVNKMRLDSSGNMIVTGNVTAYGSI